MVGLQRHGKCKHALSLTCLRNRSVCCMENERKVLQTIKQFIKKININTFVLTGNLWFDYV